VLARTHLGHRGAEAFSRDEIRMSGCFISSHSLRIVHNNSPPCRVRTLLRTALSSLIETKAWTYIVTPRYMYTPIATVCLVRTAPLAARTYK